MNFSFHITATDHHSRARTGVFHTPPLAPNITTSYNETMVTILRVKNLPEIVRREVRSTFREILSDPDAGLKLRTGVARKLKASLREKKSGRLRNFKEVHKKHQTH